jgi:hypothetical protein
LVTEWAGRIDEEKIQVSFQGKMLESVIQNRDFGLEMIHCELTSNPSFPSYYDRDPFELLRQEVWLISSLSRIHEDPLPIGHDPVRALEFSLVTPGEDGGTISPLPYHLREQANERGFPGPAQRYVSYTDYLARKGMGFIDSPPVKKNPGFQDPPIKKRK